MLSTGARLPRASRPVAPRSLPPASKDGDSFASVPSVPKARSVDSRTQGQAGRLGPSRGSEGPARPFIPSRLHLRAGPGHDGHVPATGPAGPGGISSPRAEARPARGAAWLGSQPGCSSCPSLPGPGPLARPRRAPHGRPGGPTSAWARIPAGQVRRGARGVHAGRVGRPTPQPARSARSLTHLRGL